MNEDRIEDKDYDTRHYTASDIDAATGIAFHVELALTQARMVHKYILSGFGECPMEERAKSIIEQLEEVMRKIKSQSQLQR